MIEVRFEYQVGIKTMEQHSTVIRSTISAAALHLDLPQQITIVYMKCSPRVMGGVDRRDYTKIGINSSLDLRKTVEIICHELIHVEQRKQNKLTIGNNNWYYWRGKPWISGDPELLPQHKYLELPWEEDVRIRLPQLLKNITSVTSSFSK